MTTTPDTTGLLAAARSYAERGWPIIPLRGKVPAIKQWQEFVASEINLRFHVGTHGCSVGLRTGESGYVVLDTDTPEAEAWVQAHCPETPMQAVTGSGSTHRYYREPPRKEVRNAQALRGIPGLDVRGHGGFIVLPPSIHPVTGKPYQWVGEILPPEELPRFAPSWVYRRTRRRVLSVFACHDEAPDAILRRGRAYVAKIDKAVSGAGGHTKTLIAAFKILRLTSFDLALAWELLLHYNATRCEPPWEEKDLKRKLDEALRLSSR